MWSVFPSIPSRVRRPSGSPIAALSVAPLPRRLLPRSCYSVSAGIVFGPNYRNPRLLCPRFCLLSLKVGKDVALRPGLVCPTLPECRSGSSPRGVACGSALGSKWAVAREGCCPAEEDTSALPGHPISGLALGTGQKGAQTDLWCLPHLSFVLCS